MALTQSQINQLVEEYKSVYDGDEEVTEEKVLEDLEGYMKDFTNYESIEDVPFEELIDFIGQLKGVDSMDAQQKATKKWNKNNREHRNYLSKRSSARSFIRNHATGSDLNELEVLIAERRDALMTDTEREIKQLIEDVYADELKEQSWEEVADMLDFWRDKDGYLLMEGRGMKPIDGVNYVGYADNGVIWER